MLDIAEKTCEPDEGSVLRLLERQETESVWLCCCPYPYEPCNKNEMNDHCLRAVKWHMTAHTISTNEEFLIALQKVRGELRDTGGKECRALAPMEPFSKCGSDGTPKKDRSLDREDLFCEMVAWQWEELGDGNKEEFEANGCTFDPEVQ